jgi:hypothetical protein
MLIIVDDLVEIYLISRFDVECVFFAWPWLESMKSKLANWRDSPKRPVTCNTTQLVSVLVVCCQSPKAVIL